MLNTLISLGAAAAYLGIVGGTAALISRRLWMGRAYAGVAYGLLGIGIACMLVFIGTWLSPRVGSLGSLVLVVGCLIYLASQRAWLQWRVVVRLLVLGVGVATLYLSILYLWRVDAETFSLTAMRFEEKAGLPIDNMIPYLFSERLAAGLPTHLLTGDWNGSDRPPLQAGLILLLRPFSPAIGVSPEASAFGAGIVGELLWIPGLYAGLRAFGTSPLASRVAVTFAAVTGTTLLNTIYTWPKMLSAAFVFAATALLLDAARHPERFRWSFPAAVLSFVLAVLAHGVAAFTLPWVVILGVLAYRRQSRRSILTTTGIGVLAGLLLYLSWALYQRVADPPGDRLLKWHLAGVVSIDGRSFPQALIDSYSALSPGEWLAGRVENLVTAFDPNLLIGLRGLDWTDIAARRGGEFFHVSIALDLALPTIVVIAVLVLIRRIRLRSDAVDRRFAVLVVLSLASIMFWCLLMFIPGQTFVHQGSQIWLFGLLAAPIVWLWPRSRVATVILLGAQLVLTLLYYVPSYQSDHLRAPVAVLGVVGLVLTGTATFAGPGAARVVRAALDSVHLPSRSVNS